jgi:membrane carboxypeptidase/penicillin-binding protein PbpC
VRLAELTAAYAAFATGGRPVRPSLLLSVRDRAGNQLYQWAPPPLAELAMDPRIAWLITDMLSDNQARIPSFGDNSALQIGRPAAAKTGTTTDYRDNWTVGYTPQVVAGVWVGNPDNTPMVNASGVTGAAPIWNEFMRQVLRGQPERSFEQPPGIVRAEVCAISGLLPTDQCPSRRLEWFLRGTIPTEYDTLFQEFRVDRRTGLLADEDTPADDVETRLFMVLPQEARAWGLRHGIEPPPVALDEVARNTGDLRILTPDPETIFQLSPVLPFESQRVRFSVSVPPGTRQIDYWLNGEPVGEASLEPWWAWWPLIPGDYTLEAVATLADGSTQRSPAIAFRVISYVPPEERARSGEIN